VRLPQVCNRFTPDELALLISAERGAPVAPEGPLVQRLTALGALVAAGEDAADEWTVSRDLAVLLSPVCDPAWVVRTTVMSGGASTVVTYCMQRDLTTRLTMPDEDQWELTPLLTSDLLVAIRQDLPLPPRPMRPVGGRVVGDAEVLGEVGGLVASGDHAGASARLEALGLARRTAESFVVALASPECVGSATNGTEVVAWILDRDGTLWFAPATDTPTGSRSVLLGPLDRTEVLAAVGRLLPGGPDWAHLRFPVVEALDS